jgi:hypothetical protein
VSSVSGNRRGAKSFVVVVIRDFMRIYGHSRMKDEIRAILVRSREDVGLAEKSRQGVGISSY